MKNYPRVLVNALPGYDRFEGELVRTYEERGRNLSLIRFLFEGEMEYVIALDDHFEHIPDTDDFEVVPEVFEKGKAYKRGSTGYTRFECVFADDAIALMFTGNPGGYHVMSHAARSDYEERP